MVTSFVACAQKQEKKATPSKTTKKMEYNKLTKEEEAKLNSYKKDVFLNYLNY